LPKTILFKKLPAIKKKKKKGKRDCAAGQGKKKMRKRGFVLCFHGNCLKNQKQSVR
jgi:hypothetical protein